jgi:phenylpropionate dioxygenase-like ring-hydroxylating dioxygenase large terminal subunit
MSDFPRNAWYACAFPEEIGEGLLARRLLGQPVLLYRKADGTPVAMLDRCPHRFASLSKGRRIGDQVECGYHGLRFDAAGRCTRSPYQDVPPPNAVVETFPIVERYGIGWIWMGDKAAADPALIPDHSHMHAAGYRTVSGHETYRGDWQLCNDNLLDLTHLFWLHTSTIGGYKEEAGPAPGEEYHVRQSGNQVIGRNLTPNINRPAAVANGIAPGEPYDQWNDIVWTCPGSLSFNICAAPPGVRETKPYMLQTHLITPEGEGSAHYFWAAVLHIEAAEEQRWRSFFGTIFRTEDAPMMEDIERQMAGRDLWEMKPVVLPRDKGAVIARRIVARAIAAERGVSEPVAAE